MNISFKYDKGDNKIIVSNENGVLTEIEYTDNIKELLIQENIIESLNNDKSSLENIEESLIKNLQDFGEKINEQKAKKKSVKKKSLIMFFIGTIGFTILFYLMSEVQTLSTLLSLLAADSVLFGAISIVYVTYNNSPKYNGLEEDLQERLNEQSSLLDEVKKKKEVLNKVLGREEEKYKELSAIVSKEKENQMSNQITKVEYRERLEQIRTEIKEIMGQETKTELDNLQTLALEPGLKQIRKEIREEK